MNQILMGLAVGANQRAARARRDANDAGELARVLASGYGDMVATAMAFKERALRAERQKAELEEALNLERMHAAGLLAQVMILKSAALAAGDPGKVFQPDAAGNTKFGRAYDEAHDDEGRRLGVDNPSDLRD